jgi:hypothetical protein
LEVAEHIPAPGARSFIETLVRAGPVVLFSAAIPGQGGYLHVNEQWPGYWRALFTDLGYRMVDCLRPLLWDNPEVLWWYRQNIMLFVEPAALERWRSPLLEGRADLQGLPLVHPELLRLRVGPPPINGSTALRILCSAILNRLRLARGRPDAGSGSVS